MVWIRYIVYFVPYMRREAALNKMLQPIILLLFSYFWIVPFFISWLLVFILEVIFPLSWNNYFCVALKVLFSVELLRQFFRSKCAVVVVVVIIIIIIIIVIIPIIKWYRTCVALRVLFVFER
jgi:hypothetical protein